MLKNIKISSMLKMMKISWRAKIDDKCFWQQKMMKFQNCFKISLHSKSQYVDDNDKKIHEIHSITKDYCLLTYSSCMISSIS